MHLKNGKISDAIACFAKEFEFKDRGIGLEFKDRVHGGYTLPDLVAHKDNTPPSTLFPKKRKRKMCTDPKQGHPKFHVTCFLGGNIFRRAVLYRATHYNATWGAVRKQWQVPPRFLRRALRHRSQAKGRVTIPATSD
jgi:hypothetical protein